MADKARPKMRKTTLRLPEELHRRVKVRAAEEDRHMETVVAEAIAEYLTRKIKPKRAQA